MPNEVKEYLLNVIGITHYAALYWCSKANCSEEWCPSTSQKHVPGNFQPWVSAHTKNFWCWYKLPVDISRGPVVEKDWDVPF